MRYRTELMESILQSRHAQEMIDFIAPIYGESFTALWLLEVIGRVLDSAAAYGESLKEQTVPQTVSWAISYWEDEFAITPDPLETLEERRNNILTKLGAAPPANPAMLAALAESIAGVPCTIIENVSKNTFILEMYGLSSSRIRAENAVSRAKPAHLFMRTACRFPTIIFPENPGNLLLKSLQFAFRISYYGDFIELNGKRMLDGSWILHQARLGFAFPIFQCGFAVKESYGTMPAVLRLRMPMRGVSENLRPVELKMRGLLLAKNRPGGMENGTQLTVSCIKCKNINHADISQVTYQIRVKNKYGSMPGTLEKCGILQRMNGSFQFDGTRKFSKTRSSKEEI